MEKKEIEWHSWMEKDQTNPLRLHLTEVENGIFLIISDRGPRIGTIAMGIPNISIKSQIDASSVPLVFGVRNELFCRAIAERVAHICQKIVIANVFLADESPELAQRSLKFAEEAIREYFSARGKTSTEK